MNRTIKFRGLCLKSKQWVFGGIAEKPFKGDYEWRIISTYFYEGIEEKERVDFIRVKVSSIGQFTGLRDIKGEWIFEGDKISVFGNGEYIVEWVNSSWYGVSDGGRFPLSDLRGIDYEIIGNIHEQ